MRLERIQRFAIFRAIVESHVPTRKTRNRMNIKMLLWS